MPVSRLDLDGTGSPHGLVSKILKILPDLAAPVPIEDLARQLDITKIADLETEGFEGGLLTDAGRSRGVILVNRKSRHGRRRFTIGHELGHFLIPTHRPIRPEGFLCSLDGMRQWSAAERDTYVRMEVEANKFAALLLMPPPLLRKFLSRFRDPDLAVTVAIAEEFQVSKDSAARACAENHNQKIAIAVVKDGRVLRIYKRVDFPRLAIWEGELVPTSSVYHRAPAQSRDPTDLHEVAPEIWLESSWGMRLPKLFEQVLLQQDGHALIMLWPELVEEEDDDRDADRTARERWREQQLRQNRN